jgi:transposase
VFRLRRKLKVYLHRAPVDFRLSINGLAALVEQALGLDPFAPALYVFSNRRRNRVKILGWDRNGFWLLLKRLEEDRFIWPDEVAVPTLDGGATALAARGHRRRRRAAASAARLRARELRAENAASGP